MCIRKYKFCPEFQALYDIFHKKLPMKLCIKIDKRIREMKESGDVECFYDLANIMPTVYPHDEHNELINWKNPKKKILRRIKKKVDEKEHLKREIKKFKYIK